MQDFGSILQWWFTIFVIGVVFLPLTINLFSNFFDKGYIFSKIIGIVAISYTIFILGLSHIASFTKPTLFLLLTFYLFLNIRLYLINKNEKISLNNTLVRNFKEKWVVFLLEEIIFFVTLLFWSFVRSHQPDIHGLEKYMDFGFINSILRSEYFPPKDVWFTPFSINYYYFGHLVTAVLTKISSISSNISYNLMLSSIFAFTFTASFSIGANLIWQMLKSQIKNHNVKNSKALDLGNWNLFGTLNFKFGAFMGGLLTAALVSFAGNLQIIYVFFKPYQNENPVPFWNLAF